MANTNYIEEFLVKLGYQVDEADRKKFEEALRKSEKSTEGLAKNLKSVAVALGTVSSVAAYRLNALYVNAQRIGTSASRLDALRRSVANVGGDANAAAQSVASLAQKLRDNPEGFAGAFKRFGINIRDTNGQIRDTVDLMMELVNSNSFKSLEYYQQSAYMRDLFGIDDLTFRSIRSGEFAREYQKIRDIQAKLGNETDKSAKSVRDFMVGLNDIRNKGSAALDVLVGNLADKLAPVLQAVNEKADALLDWYSKLSPESKEVAKNIGSTAVAIGMLAASLKAIAVLKGLGGLLKGGAAAGGAGGAAAGGAGGAAAGGGLLSKTVAVASNPVSWLAALGLGSFAADAYMTSRDADSVMSRETDGDLVGALYNGSINPASHKKAEESAGIIPAAQAAELPKKGNPGRLTAQDVMQFFVDKGLTREQAAGIAANIQKESSFDHTAVGDNGKAYGYGQWRSDKAAGARQQLFKKWFGKDIRESTPQEQLEFYWKELQTTERRALRLLLKAKTARESGEIISRHFEKPDDKYGTKARDRGQLAEQFNQNVTITINGTGNPEATGRAVKRELENGVRDFSNPAR